MVKISVLELRLTLAAACRHLCAVESDLGERCESGAVAPVSRSSISVSLVSSPLRPAAVRLVTFHSLFGRNRR